MKVRKDWTNLKYWKKFIKFLKKLFTNLKIYAIIILLKQEREYLNMKTIKIKEWFKNTKTQYDLKVDIDGLYAFRAMDKYDVTIEKETEKAILIKLHNCLDSILNGKTLWLPKSVVEEVKGE